MNRKNVLAVCSACGIAFSGSVLAYGGISGTASAMSSGRLTSGNSFSISIKVPYDMTLKSELGLPASSGKALYMDFDATQIPVHELPPLPLTLDAPKKSS